MTMRTFFGITLVSIVLSWGTAAEGATLTVTTTNQQGPGCTLSDAIKAVNLNLPVNDCPTGQGVDTIHVPAGIYDLSTPAVNEDGELTGLPYITLPIRIVGDGAGVTIIRRLPSAPAFRLLKAQAPIEIQGLTLAGGAANHYRGGGAILAETFNWANLPGGNARMTITVRDVTFDNNTAPTGGAIADTGFYYGPFVEVTVANAIFSGNHAQSGGAIGVAPNSVLHVANSRFVDNSADAWGGAIYNSVDAAIDVSDTRFERNSSGADGGAIHAGSPVLTRTAFIDNVTVAGGGALYSYGGRPAIGHSSFSGNQARRGGAIEVNAGSVAIDGSTLSDNTATWYEGGAVWLDDRPRTSRITNSTISANRSSIYGALSLVNGAVTIINSTIVGNTNVPGGWSAGITAGSSGGNEVILSNSIVAGNTSDGGAADLHVDPNSGGDRFVSLGHNLIGSNRHVETVFIVGGDLAGTPEQPLDPGVSALADNGGATWTHALLSASPAIDAGSLAATGTDEACEPVDQRGAPRPGPGTSVCDIGAFEADRSVVPGGTTTTTVTASPNPSLAGEAVTITATIVVEAPGTGTPTGSVTFIETTTSTGLGSAALDAGGVASVATSALPAGLRTIQAVYAGDGAFTPSTGTVYQTVVAPASATVTTLTTSANPAASGAAVTLTATVGSPSGGIPIGSVTFVHQPTSSILGVATLGTDGSAAVTTSQLPEGTYSLQAIYAGNSAFLPSEAVLTQAVAPAPSTAIRNGDPESRAQFDAVGILSSSSGRPTCTGTLISPFVVLTAAQCLQDSSADPIFEFSLGPGRTALVTDVRVHPGFDPGNGEGFNLAYDVALIKLDEAAAGSWTDIASLLVGQSNPAIGTHGTAVGVGAARVSGDLLVNDYPGGEAAPGVPLPDAFIEVVPGDSKDQMFCPVGAGGPLVSDGQVAGIASFRFVESCADAGPGYYVTTSRLADWIQTVLVEFDTTPPVLHFPANLVLEITSGLSTPLPDVVTAIDAVDGPIVPTCTPTLLFIGTTRVRCSATDAAGNRANGRFTVTVTAPVLLGYARALLEATLQAPGTSRQMQKLAQQLVDDITGGRYRRICELLFRYEDQLARALQQGRISAATAASLRAIAAQASSTAGCIP